MTRPSDIRKRILKQRGVELKRLSRKPVQYEDMSSSFRKSTLMRLVEMKYRDKLENLIFKGTIYETAIRLGIDATTVSKWRTLINKAKDNEFFDQFKEATV